MNQDAPSSGRKKRAYKELPLDLLDVAPKDITSVVCAVELDKTTDKDVQMAQKVACWLQQCSTVVGWEGRSLQQGTMA